MPSNTQTKHIKITTDVKGAPDLKKTARQFGQMNRNIKKSSDSLGLLRNAFLSITAGFGVRELARASDEFQLLQDRITSFTGSADLAKNVFMDLSVAAKITKSSIAGLAEVYNRVALAVSDLGVSSDGILGTTLALQQSFRLSGSTMAEATGATIQLTQGLSAGALRGQELRSVLESNAVLSGLLAEKFNVARGQLIKLAETGAITSKKVFEVLADNFDQLNIKADSLGQTFEQSLTIGLDAVKLKIQELNKEFDLSGKFARGVEYFIDNFETIGKSAATLGSALATAAIGKRILSMAKNFNIVSAAVIAVASGITYLTATWETSSLKIEKYNLIIQNSILKAKKAINFGPLRDKFLDLLPDQLGRVAKIYLKFKDTVDDNDIPKRIKEIDLALKSLGDGNKGKSPFSISAELIKRLKKGLEDAARTMKGSSKGLKIVNEDMARFNGLLNRGVIGLDTYKEGIESIKRLKLEKDFATGAISIEKYVSGMTKLNDQLTLNESLSYGARDGMSAYLKSVGTLATGISGIVTNVFKGMEDAMFEFVKTGKVSFKELTQSILDDMLRIAIRQAITAPLAQGIGGLFTGGGNTPVAQPAFQNTQGTLTAANGNAFNSGVKMFATGGVVDSPTPFTYGGGKKGLMGEAGSEAILPLTRGKSGNLGVETSGLGSNVTVNVINQADNSKAVTKETKGPNGEREIEVLILSTVQNGLAKGSFDRTMGTKYGLTPKGR